MTTGMHRYWFPRLDHNARAIAAPYANRSGQWKGRTIQPGELIAWREDRRPHRLVEVREIPDDLWGDHFDSLWAQHGSPDVARPTWEYRPVSLVVTTPSGGRPRHLRCSAGSEVYVLDEHHPICAACGQVPPCHDADITAQVAREMEAMDRVMQIPLGHCLGCGEYVTQRQDGVRFPGPNLWRPDFPEGSALFHARRACSGWRRSYEADLEKRSATADGANRV